MEIWQETRCAISALHKAIWLPCLCCDYNTTSLFVAMKVNFFLHCTQTLVFDIDYFQHLFLLSQEHYFISSLRAMLWQKNVSVISLSTPKRRNGEQLLINLILKERIPSRIVLLDGIPLISHVKFLICRTKI